MKTRLLLLLLPALAIGQDCKFYENKVDEFTKDSLKSFSGGRGFYFRKINNNAALVFTYMGLGAAYSISKGDQLILKMEDGSTVELINSVSDLGPTSISSGITTTTVRGTYPLDKESLQKISSQKVDKIRMYLTRSFVEHDLKSKDAGKVQLAAKCMLTTF